MNRQTSSAGSDLPTLPPRQPGSRLRSGWVVLLGCAGIAVFAGFLWLVEHTAPPPLPVLVVMVLAVVGLVVGPWAYLAARRLAGEPAAGRILRRILAVGGTLAGAGVVVAAAITISGTGEPGTAGAVAMFSILVAGLLALVGVVVFPWLFLLTRTVTRERAARVRAEERAEVATHLHDSVLQTLTLIQKRTGDPAEMARLARRRARAAWLALRGLGPCHRPGRPGRGAACRRRRGRGPPRRLG